jgi:hypothetical protein
MYCNYFVYSKVANRGMTLDTQGNKKISANKGNIENKLTNSKSTS